MGDLARRHHVVSRFYLRYFAKNDQVTTVMLPGDRSFIQSVGDASVRTDFYTVVGHDGQPTDVIEQQAFSAIESAAADAWRELQHGAWPLSEEHRANMAGWLALQLLRGSRVRDSMSEIGSHALQLEIAVGGRRRLREVLTDLGEPHDDEAVDRGWVALFEDPFPVEAHANHHMRHLAEMLPRVTESLLDRWWLLTVFERKGLATSDHPVHVVPNRAFAEVGMGTGIENANVIHVPLTRRHSLAMSLRSSLPEELAAQGRDARFPGAAATALYSNSCSVNSARRFLFHHPKDSPLAGIDLPSPRDREVAVSANLWGFMSEEDRQVLIDAGIEPAGDPHEE